MLRDLLDAKIAQLELWRILFFCGVILLSLVVGKIVKFFMEKAAGYSNNEKENNELLFLILKALSRAVVLAAFTIGWWIGINAFVGISVTFQNLAAVIGNVLNAVTIGYALYSLVDVIDFYLIKFASKTHSKIDDVLAPLLGKSIRITVFVLVLINVIQQISGKSISTILAGLGIGSLAVALAAQDSIKNFFGSIVVLLDKPFEIGDRIVVEGHDGPVESIGFRSTRIRTLDGHLVVVPNSELVNKTVLNIGKRPYIRRVANITITYDTPPEKVEKAVAIIKEILAEHEGMHSDFPPRVFFDKFNDTSLNIVIMYWYHPPDYWKYMAFSEKVNMEILRRFNEEGIDFAFPTQTIYLANDNKRQLALKMLNDQMKAQ